MGASWGFQGEDKFRVEAMRFKVQLLLAAVLVGRFVGRRNKWLVAGAAARLLQYTVPPENS